MESKEQALVPEIDMKSIPSVSFNAWLVCVVSSLFFFYEFVQLNMFNALNPELMADFSVSASEIGNLFSYYMIANVVFLLPAGMLLDRFSTKRLIIGAMILCILSTVLFALSEVLWQAKVARFLTGLGSTICFLSCVRLASRWFPPERMALVTGVIVTIAMLGGVTAQSPMTELVVRWGWRQALLINAGVGVFLVGLIAMVVNDYPLDNSDRWRTNQTRLQELGLLQSCQWVIKNPQNWLAGTYTCLLNLPIFIFGAVWGGMYLTQYHHVPRLQASVITSMVFVGTIIGSPLYGWYSDKIKKRRAPMIGGAVMTILTMICIMLIAEPSITLLLLLFFALGLFSSSQVLSYPAVAESNPAMLTGTAVGFSAVLIMGGGVVFPPLFGWLMDLSWDGTKVNGIPWYRAEDFFYAMLILPICFVVGLLMAYFFQETNGKACD